MIIEIISIGTELLLGDIVDTNSAYIAKNLTANGYDINYISTVGDNKKRLIKTLSRAFNRADIVITTGGIGPTEDDLTREAISKVTELPLIKQPELIQTIKDHFKHRDYQMTENNFKQAYLPEGAKPIPNHWGTAPGILLEIDQKVIFSLPGVPREMKKMFNSGVLPYLQEMNDTYIKSKTLHFIGIGESTLETEIIDILEKQSNPTLALLAGKGEVKIRITAKGNSKNEIEELLQEKEREIRGRVGKHIYGIDEETLAGKIGEILTDQNLSLSLAESCTGGLIGNRITDIPGSSQYFKGGVMVYSNEAKIDQIHVNPETLKKYGAVSKQTAREMANGVRNLFKTDLSVSVTGIAGPGGGSEEKPVGLVYIGLADSNNTEVYKLNLNGDRLWNKWMSSQYALYYLYRHMRNL